MKRLMATTLFCFYIVLAFTQNVDEKSVQLQFKKRTKFARVDERYNIFQDTLFYANSGFRVYADFDVDTLESGEEYVIFRYPNWQRKLKIKSSEDNEKTAKNEPSENSSANSYTSWHQGLAFGNNKNEQQKALALYMAAELSNDSLLEKLSEALKNSKIPAITPEFENVEINKEDSILIQTYLQKIDSLSSIINNNYLLKPVRIELAGQNNRRIAMPIEEFDKLKLAGNVKDIYSLKLKSSTRIASGFMTIPFKLRPKQDSINFNMTTDITLGAYLGFKKRITRAGNNFIVIPLTLGLSYINVNNNQTSNVKFENNASIVPGWTWSSGIVFDLNGFNVGLVLGQDYASGIGDDWLYNKKLWYSFSIGYSFFSGKK